MLNDKWYSSEKIREILQISSQCLYAMKIHNKIECKKISDKKYLYKLPDSFNESQEKYIAIYARVSTPKQKNDLDNQIKLLKEYSVSKGYIINPNYVYKDIASGMNENRHDLKRLIKEITNGNISSVIISNRDRLTRFGFGYFKTFFDLYNVNIIEVNLTEENSFENELTSDLIAIIHHFSMKFYGKRKNILKKCLNEIKNDKK